MANEKNLKPIRSKSEAREKGKKGGQKSGEVRREKKAFRELAEQVLSYENKNEEITAIAKSFGIEEPDNKTLVILGLTRAAIYGNHNAFDRLYELTGEKSSNANIEIMEKLDKVIGDIDVIADE